MIENKLWVLEYSPSLKQFHNNKLNKSLEANLKKAVEGNDLDWIPVACAESMEELGKISDLLRPHLLGQDSATGETLKK